MEEQDMDPVTVRALMMWDQLMEKSSSELLELATDATLLVAVRKEMKVRDLLAHMAMKVPEPPDAVYTVIHNRMEKRGKLGHE